MVKYSLPVALLAVCVATVITCLWVQKNNLSSTPRTLELPQPKEGEENEKLREQYENLRHQTAPDADWKAIEAANAKATLQRVSQQGFRVMESFANGAISGTWSERGASNQAGSIRAVDYVAANNRLYTISNGGSLWSSVLESGNWTLLNQAYRFNHRSLSAFAKVGGGVRIIVSVGEQVMYSDDEGATFTPSTGIQFPVPWRWNHVAQFIRMNDGSNTLYCLTRPWSDVGRAPRFWLYRSTDEGASFTRIFTFATGDEGRLSMCNPYNTNDLYVADGKSSLGTVKLYTVSGATVNLTSSFTPGPGVGDDILCLLKGTRAGGVTTLYLMLNNKAIYRSTNLGTTWTLRSNLPEDAWMKMNVSISNPGMISYGGVNAYRSANGGSSFTKVNDWTEYYGNVAQKLHADIMEIEYFRKIDNTEFAIINTHGGTYLSYDHLETIYNLSLLSHHATEYYDVLTDTFHNNRIFGGTQDQGVQRTLTGTTAGIQPFLQIVSGDYGQMALTANGQFLWPQYPGGEFLFFTDLGATNPTYIGGWTMPGTHKPNYGWMLPVASTANAAANEIWMGGGNIDGGGGSFLIKLSMQTTAPYTITPTQLPYDFRANSRNGSASITAIEQSLINHNRLYVALEDGSFFHSADAGESWSKTSLFNGPTPWYLYGSTILASCKNQNLVWYAGSGYSNPPVYVSTDAGATFSPMSDGLPPTLVNEIVASPNEDFLFAATEAGPYVYVQAMSKWFSLTTANMPVQFFSGVEYIPGLNIVRFSTMGRGIWDFTITSGSALPVTHLQFEGHYRNGSSLLSWSTASETNSSHFMVQRSFDGMHFTDIGKVTAAGNSNTTRLYAFTDHLSSLNRPFTEVFYRLRQVDSNGRAKLSKVVRIDVKESSFFTLLANPVRNTATLQYRSTVAEKIIIRVYDASGKMVVVKSMNAVAGKNQYHLDASAWSRGVYMAELQNSRETLLLRLLKQ